MTTRIAISLLTVALLAPMAPMARADSTGTTGRLVTVEHVDDDSDDYGTYHGRIFVDVGSGLLNEYRWGGVICSGRDLDIDQQRLLVSAMNKKLVLIPYWKIGMGGIRCLMSFSIVSGAKLAPVVSK